MCETCEELGVLHESYAAKKARIAKFWTPRRPRTTPIAAEVVSVEKAEDGKQ
jgi:hypothetical protein